MEIGYEPVVVFVVGVLLPLLIEFVNETYFDLRPLGNKKQVKAIRRLFAVGTTIIVTIILTGVYTHSTGEITFMGFWGAFFSILILNQVSYRAALKKYLKPKRIDIKDSDLE